MKIVITEIGEMVRALLEDKVLITFGPKASNELKEISVFHNMDEIDEENFIVGGQLNIAGKAYTIKAKGKEAEKNFKELGHVSFYFKDDEELLPGAIELVPHDIPSHIQVGDLITNK